MSEDKFDLSELAFKAGDFLEATERVVKEEGDELFVADGYYGGERIREECARTANQLLAERIRKSKPLRVFECKTSGEVRLRITEMPCNWCVGYEGYLVCVRKVKGE